VPELDELPLVLKRRLLTLGISPVQAAERMARQDSATPGNGSSPAPKAPTTPKPALTAAELKAKVTARAKAAAIPSGAHGAPVASGEPIEGHKKGTGLKGSLDRLQKLIPGWVPKG
jgi:hypothetical protein